MRAGQPWAICDRCGFRKKLADLRTEWTNLKVCDPCYDPRPVHLDTPRLNPGEGAPLPGARPDTIDEATDEELSFAYRDGTTFTPE